MIFGAGETKEFSRRLGGLRSRFPSLPKFPAIATKMKPEHFAILVDGYLSAIRRSADGGARYRQASHQLLFRRPLHLLFPNARFINTRRNPVDTCWSAFTKLFKDDMPHSYDFGELGRYHRKYEELMDYWQAVLPPGTIRTIVYEEVVDDVETCARGLVDFVGLPWDAACLAFHDRNARSRRRAWSRCASRSIAVLSIAGGATASRFSRLSMRSATCRTRVRARTGLANRWCAAPGRQHRPGSRSPPRT